MSEDVEIVPDDEAAPGEAWRRLTGDPDFRGVTAGRYVAEGWPWYVRIAVAEFLREEPLEAELRTRIPGVLRCVGGVTDVAEDDREVWLVAGTPSGEALVRAAAVVVDDMAGRARAHIEASSGQ